MKPKRLVVAPPLRRGDLVGVIAPGFAVDRRAVESGIEMILRLGLRVREGKSLFARAAYFAGGDAARARDLAAMIEDEEVRAIHFARGGWGISRILDAVPFEVLDRRPKLLIGYSDLTALFAPALDRCGLSSVYGPHVSELGRPHAFDRRSLLRAYFTPRRPLVVRFPASSVLIPGRCTGRCAGGCLSLLAHLSGTPYAPALRGRVLLIEEVSELPFRIDRMLTQLRLAGAFDRLAGVLVGSLTGCTGRPKAGRSPSAREVIRSAFEPFGIPVVAGLRFGHIGAKLSIPLGFRTSIDTARGRIVFSP